MGLFCDAALAARVERTEMARVVAGAELRGFAIAIGGGYATYAEHGSPLNKVVWRWPMACRRPGPVRRSRTVSRR